jgi:type II secretory pathway predicted ATPase ExeA
MYTTHFGFNEKPFTLTPNPRFMYLSHNHKEAFAHLLYGINNRHGFMCLIGEVGTGKTTLLRSLLGRLQDELYRTALIFNPCMTGVELLQSINQEFGIRSGSDQASELLNMLNHYLLSENSQGHTVVLVIDEAQNLKPEVLEQIRLISNLETENDKLIQIILAGQPELKKLLKKPELRQLNQRIAVRYTLKPMNRDETGAYIRHRIEMAGDDCEVSFSDRAVALIHLYSRGTPRMINILCDRALLNAYSHEQHHVAAWTVFKAICELRELPTPGQAKEYRPSAAHRRRKQGFFSSRKPAPTVSNAAPAPQPDTYQVDPPACEAGSPEHFDLGEELRLELDDDDRISDMESDSGKGLSLLHSMMEELNDPDQHSGIVLLMLRFAAEYLNRAVVFMVQDSIVSGVGQFGFGDETISGDERVRAINFSLESGSMFHSPYRSARATVFKPELTTANRLFFDQLGGGIPNEAFIGPIVSRSRVIGFLYGDNLPDKNKIGRTESLEIFLSQTGAAMEKILLERQLQERGRQ